MEIPGYGLTVPSGRFEPRQLSNQFPYLSPDPYADDEYDEYDGSSDAFMTKANMGHLPTDSLKKTDPFYFAAGNLKISEIAVGKDNISPIHDLYNNLVGVSGGSTKSKAYDNFSARKTGTTQGYFHRPPGVLPPHIEIGAYRLVDMLDDDALAIAKVDATQDYIDKISNIEKEEPYFV